MSVGHKILCFKRVVNKQILIDRHRNTILKLIFKLLLKCGHLVWIIIVYQFVRNTKLTNNIFVGPDSSIGLKQGINTKSKCNSPIGTASLLVFIVLLLLLQHRSSQYMYIVLGPYNTSLLKANRCRA